MQEAALRALRTRHPWAGQSQFSTWFMRVAINCALMARRPSGTFNRSVELTDELADSASKAQANVSDILERDLVRLAILHLTPKNRSVVMLYYLDGHNIREIAVLLDLKFHTVKSRLCKSRVKMKRELEGLRAA